MLFSKFFSWLLVMPGMQQLLKASLLKLVDKKDSDCLVQRLAVWTLDNYVKKQGGVDVINILGKCSLNCQFSEQVSVKLYVVKINLDMFYRDYGICTLVFC